MQQICISWHRDLRWDGTMCTRVSNWNKKERSQSMRISGFKWVSTKLLCFCWTEDKEISINVEFIGVKMWNATDCVIYINPARSLSVITGLMWQQWLVVQPSSVLKWSLVLRCGWGGGAGWASQPEHKPASPQSSPALGWGPFQVCGTQVLQKFRVRPV